MISGRKVSLISNINPRNFLYYFYWRFVKFEISVKMKLSFIAKCTTTVLELENLKPFSLVNFSIFLSESCNCLSMTFMLFCFCTITNLEVINIWRAVNIMLKVLSYTIYFKAKQNNREGTSFRNTHFLFKKDSKMVEFTHTLKFLSN